MGFSENLEGGVVGGDDGLAADFREALQNGLGKGGTLLGVGGGTDLIDEHQAV